MEEQLVQGRQLGGGAGLQVEDCLRHATGGHVGAGRLAGRRLSAACNGGHAGAMQRGPCRGHATGAMQGPCRGHATGGHAGAGCFSCHAGAMQGPCRGQLLELPGKQPCTNELVALQQKYLRVCRYTCARTHARTHTHTHTHTHTRHTAWAARSLRSCCHGRACSLQHSAHGRMTRHAGHASVRARLTQMVLCHWLTLGRLTLAINVGCPPSLFLAAHLHTHTLQPSSLECATQHTCPHRNAPCNTAHRST